MLDDLSVIQYTRLMSAIEAIMQFRDEFEFLSNFYLHPIVYNGKDWKTSEHAYQAAKTLVAAEIQKIADAPSPGRAKRFGGPPEKGGIVTLRQDWKTVRVPIMYDILSEKFSDPQLEERLLATGQLKLVEGNTWNDTFWGVDIRTGVGQNMLGRLLMRIREDKLYFS